MKHDPTVKSFLLAVIAAAAMACIVDFCCASHAGATQPPCVGDRHYDNTGECCPVQSSTTTTIPGNSECEVCEPVLPCPPPAPCPGVTCECEPGTSQIVYVDRCPQPEVMEVCKVRKNGSVVCPRAKKPKHPGPRKIYVPRSIIDQIADDTRY